MPLKVVECRVVEGHVELDRAASWKAVVWLAMMAGYDGWFLSYGIVVGHNIMAASLKHDIFIVWILLC